jgi:hypothetical protein
MHSVLATAGRAAPRILAFDFRRIPVSERQLRRAGRPFGQAKKGADQGEHSEAASGIEPLYRVLQTLNSLYTEAFVVS